MHKKSLAKIIGFGFAVSIVALMPTGTYAEKNQPAVTAQSQIEMKQTEVGVKKTTDSANMAGEEAHKEDPEKETANGNDSLEEKASQGDISNTSGESVGEANPDEGTSDAGISDNKTAGGVTTGDASKDETSKDEASQGQEEEQVPPQEVSGDEGDQNQKDSQKKENKDIDKGDKKETKDKEDKDKEEKEDKELEKDLVVSAIHAGTGSYKEDLKQQYGLTFSEDIGVVMDEIEEEYIQENQIRQEEGEEQIRAENWQDVIAVYLLRLKQSGESTFHLSKENKKGLKEVYKEMNRLVVVEKSISAEKRSLLYTNLNLSPVLYENLHVEELVRRDNALEEPAYGEDEISFLEKYSSNECTILCAAATNAQGFARQSLAGVSKERKAVVESAYSLVGKIAYFWGGKSTAIGWDDRWGEMAKVSAGGSLESGSIMEYGLDCSGFVSWAFINGAYNSESEISSVGAGTGGQWNASEAVSEEEALPGDLVFLSPPGDSASAEHVGIVVGKTSDGELIAVHCNASDNGVAVQSAYEAGFRYVRSPKVFSGADEINKN